MVVRKHDKRGIAYYFNKSTGKRTSKTGWKISLSHRQEKPSYREKEVGGKKVKVRLGKVRKGISYQKVSSLKKQRSKLYSNRYYWNNKLTALLKAGATKKSINDAKRKLSIITAKIKQINRKLGIVYLVKPTPKVKVEKVGKLYSEKFIHWQAREELESLLKKGTFSKYEILGEIINKNMKGDILMEFESMVQIAFESQQTPWIVFVYDYKNKLVRLFIYQ